ncbi:MAG TPA: site-specific DNA-methyltransferase [Candidatus Glassbacteria bacterium]|nr:site-specific DNA-methyltransferase [Candidatus Glassbacteria bacterium]
MNKLIHGTWQDELPKLQNNSIDLIILDPPYLTTKEKWDKDEVVNDELTSQLFRIAKENCSLYVWCGIGEKSQSLIRWFPIFSKNWYFKDLITWKKQRGIGMRKGWLYTREELMWFVKDNKQFVWNKEFQYSEQRRIRDGGKDEIKVSQNGAFCKSLYKRWTNVWDDITEQSFNIINNKTHYTPKPILAIKRLILAHTKEKDTVLDCFLGSGTTMQACNELSRNCIGIEKELEYYEYCKQYA